MFEQLPSAMLIEAIFITNDKVYNKHGIAIQHIRFGIFTVKCIPLRCRYSINTRDTIESNCITNERRSHPIEARGLNWQFHAMISFKLNINMNIRKTCIWNLFCTVSNWSYFWRMTTANACWIFHLLGSSISVSISIPFINCSTKKWEREIEV